MEPGWLTGLGKVLLVVFPWSSTQLLGMQPENSVVLALPDMIMLQETDSQVTNLTKKKTDKVERQFIHSQWQRYPAG